ncbi:hypothetical protein [Phaeobacter inhibens]|uniref:hypothetical protein n=1 Tax=Phaeobacter inhibens TaxID=221822 RepID=UPI0021A3B5FC|nr:hypothetical protein [Phaeobacter inhibens]UWR62807.1 hypothetical protein K4F88_19220 [Phaeobacter inhibens]
MNGKLTASVCFVAWMLVGFAPPAAAEEPRSWNCEKQAVFDPSVQNHIREISAKPSMRNIIIEHMKRWDAAEMRSQCEAFADGKPNEISCLNGRRNWDEIEASIPSGLTQVSALNQREHLLKIQAEGNGLAEAIEFCRSSGATPVGDFSLQILKD